MALDALTYHYDAANLNRLQWVDDAVAAGPILEDVHDQAAGNYGYDAIGNLTSDAQSGVTAIRWTPYGKIADITKQDGTTTAYAYDAQGNRVRKVFTLPQQPAVTTYYVRDAQGNVLATYEATGAGTADLLEQPIYGSARLGGRKPTTAPGVPRALGVNGLIYKRTLGQRVYELSDHLGNVRVVVGDGKDAMLTSMAGGLAAGM